MMTKLGYCLNAVLRLSDEHHVLFCLDNRGKSLAKDRMIFDTQDSNPFGLGHNGSPRLAQCNSCLCRYSASEGIFETLKRFLSILRVLIFESKVDRAIPNLAAAPEGPKTRPRDSVRAASIACFSSSAILCRSSHWFVGDARNGCRDIQLSSTEKLSLSET